MFFKSLFCACTTLLCSTIASAQPYNTDFSKGELVVESVKRTSDDTVLVKGTLKNTTNESVYLPSAGLASGDGVFMVTLQELKTKKQFEQVRVEGTRVGSKHSHVDAGSTVKFWARVTAPPKDVTQVTVLFGGDAVPLDGVTVSE